jgi:CCR4-NOT transcription complex subunit 1
VVKDFAVEGSELKMRGAAQLMVANLAGSLAVVTCKEPLRLSMANHLRTLLSAAAAQQQQQAAAAAASSGAAPPAVPVDFAANLEQAVQTAATDNLELGCLLIEKAATEAAIRDVDDALAGPLAERRQFAQQGAGSGPQFADAAFAGKRYPQALPEMLRPSPRGLGPAQLLVYEAFARQPRPPPPAPGAAGGPGAVAAAAAGGEGAAAGALMDASQAMALYGRLVTALEAALAGVAAAAGPSRAGQLTLALLGPDHAVCQLVRQAAQVAGQVAAPERDAAVYQFARTVFFKKVVEQPSQPDEVRALGE